ncbi:MAG: DUF721 domain-containing protein [Roseinatronobacter sp.]
MAKLSGMDQAGAAGAARRRRGFEPAAQLVAPQIRKAGESRGFAIARLLTHWAEVAGPDIAGLCRPVRINYGKGAMGGTLTLLTTGAAGPMLQMELPQLRARVNACYGYNAIARIVLTQTAPTGFAEGQASFTPAPPPAPARSQSRDGAARLEAAAGRAAHIDDADLRAALERLALNVLSRSEPKETKA